MLYMEVESCPKAEEIKQWLFKYTTPQLMVDWKNDCIPLINQKPVVNIDQLNLKVKDTDQLHYKSTKIC